MQKTKRKKKKKSLTYVVISKIIWVLSIVLMLILGYFIFDANILPFKYFMTIVIVLIILISIHGLIVLKKNTKKVVLILIDIFAVFFMLIEGYAIYQINDTISFLKSNLGAHFETNVYNIVVSKNSSYETLEDIKDHTIKTVKDLEDTTEYENAIKRKVNVNIEYVDDVVSLMDEVVDDNELIIIINSGNYDAKVSIDEEYEEKVQVLDSITITTEKRVTDTGIDVTKDPFVLYLSGIDTRSNYLPSRSLSDVNIILAINPNTHNILMIHIPRDYYVQVHGTEGLKDKLTHSGTIGGIELSMATIEDLLEIKIPYYLRVNFNAVVNLVDAIGGININSDVDYDFSCWTNRSCVFHPGLNSVGGTCALAFARERHAYGSGDRHRGENQEQVISLIIDKVTSSSTIINNYNNILAALDGTFETNLTSDDITSLVKMQLDDMRGWQMTTKNVDGTGASLPTYSYPNQKLYVMEPKMETVTEAIAKLNEVLETPDEE